MTFSTVRKLNVASGMLVLLDPGGDEPGATGYATRIYTGYHVIRVVPGTYVVGRQLDSPAAAAVTIRHSEQHGDVRFLDAGRAFNVAGGRFIIADAQALTRAVLDLVAAGTAAPTDGTWMVLEKWTRTSSRLTWDHAPPGTTYVGIEPA